MQSPAFAPGFVFCEGVPAWDIDLRGAALIMAIIVAENGGIFSDAL